MMERKKGTRFHLRNDIVFVAVLLVISVIGLLYLFVFRKEGNIVKVTVDGKVYGTYSLSQDISQEIRTGKNGEHFNSFVIRNGKVYMDNASCPDGICVAHRPAFRDGESIVCLPNRVVITVITDDVKDSADIVA